LQALQLVVQCVAQIGAANQQALLAQPNVIGAH
jgi:hypothetical protein